MQIIESFRKLLTKPFPVEEREWGSIRIMLMIGAFVCFFLFIFQPFGIANLEQGKFLMCLGFGIMTVVASLTFSLGISKLLGLHHRQKNYTFGKWILSMIGVLLTISLANFLFARSYFGTIRWEFFPAMIYSTVTIGIFPIFILGMITLRRMEKKYQGIAKQINEKEKIADKPSVEEPLILGIPLTRIKYVEAWQNYVKIGFTNAENTLTEQTERATLKEISALCIGSEIVKCHRSFLVNKTAIASVSGNAQGLIIQLNNCDKEIPVSRSFVADFR